MVQEALTRTGMAALPAVIENKGLCCALYSDRVSHFFVTPKAGEKVDKNRLTQVGRAMKGVGVQMIPAYSPQARGRPERSFGTWQGRLPQELRLAAITTLEGANAFLNEHSMGECNGKFKVPAKEKGTAFRKTARRDLDWVFTVQTERVVGKDNTVAIGDRSWQLGKSQCRQTLAGTTVTIHEHVDGRVSVRWWAHVVAGAAAPEQAGEEVQRAPLCKSPSHCRIVGCEPNLAFQPLLTPVEPLCQLGRNAREHGHAIMCFFRPRPVSRKLLKNNTPATRFLNACPKSAEM